MTDPHPPLSDDELSAHLDGEADDHVGPAIDADPAARARHDELAGAARALADLPRPELDGDSVDDLIATALDTPVAPTAPSRRRGSSPWLVAAAILVLVAVGLALIWNGLHSSDSSTAAKFDTVGASISAESSKSSSGGSASAATDEAAPTTTVPPTSLASGGVVAYLGSFATGDELRAALATSWTASDQGTGGEPPATEAPPATDALDRCDQQLQVTLSLGARAQQRGYASVAGKPVLVYEFASTSFSDGSPTTLVAAVGPTSCDPVVIFQR